MCWHNQIFSFFCIMTPYTRNVSLILSSNAGFWKYFYLKVWNANGIFSLKYRNWTFQKIWNQIKIIEIKVSKALEIKHWNQSKANRNKPYSGAHSRFPVGEGANIPFSKFPIKKNLHEIKKNVRSREGGRVWGYWGRGGGARSANAI